MIDMKIAKGLNTLNIYNRVNESTVKGLQKLSSGKKINNAAKIAISEKIKAQIEGCKKWKQIYKMEFDLFKPLKSYNLNMGLVITATRFYHAIRLYVPTRGYAYQLERKCSLTKYHR